MWDTITVYSYRSDTSQYSVLRRPSNLPHLAAARNSIRIFIRIRESVILLSPPSSQYRQYRQTAIHFTAISCCRWSKWTLSEADGCSSPCAHGALRNDGSPQSNTCPILSIAFVHSNHATFRPPITSCFILMLIKPTITIYTFRKESDTFCKGSKSKLCAERCDCRL